MALTLKPKDDETYTECYARTLGPVDRYLKMTPKQLGRRLADVQRELGACLIILRKEPESITANELVSVLESHCEAVGKEFRKRHGIDAAKIEQVRERLREIQVGKEA